MDVLVRDHVVDILLIEEDPAAVETVRAAIKDSGLACRLTVMQGGDQAIGQFRDSVLSRERLVPDLILVNLQLTGQKGPAVLAEVRYDDRLRQVPVVVLVSPTDGRDVLEAFDLEAWHCVRKSNNIGLFSRRLREVVKFCLRGMPSRGLLSGENADPQPIAQAIMSKLKPCRMTLRFGDAIAGGIRWRRAHSDSWTHRRRSA